MRLDNILFRVGVAATIPSARQLISHGHILVNNNKVNIPSYNCQSQDQIKLDKNIRSNDWIKKLLIKKKREHLIPSHLNVNKKKLEIMVLDNFQYKEVGLHLNELLIIEYYSRS